MGMSGWQKFRTVELPLALPLVAAGVRLSLVQIWATATIAALVSGPGLGNVIASGFFNGNYPKGLGGAIVVAVVALILEVVAAMLQRAVSSERTNGVWGKSVSVRVDFGGLGLIKKKKPEYNIKHSTTS